MPLHVIRDKPLGIWLHDFTAPFYTYIRVWHSIQSEYPDNLTGYESIVLKSKIQVSVFGRVRKESESKIILSVNCIKEFTYE